MEFYSFLTLFSFLFGLTLGSFLNVCIHRLPLGQSIIHPPSACPRCGERIRFHDNIPVFSYILLLGRCRACRSPISIRYPIVELITGLLSLALFMRYGLTPYYFSFFTFASLLVIITFVDLEHQIIPDIISLPGILFGILLSFLLKHVEWMDSLIGVVGGGGFLYLVAAVFERLSRREGMGGGDVKLLAMIGAWLGWKPLPFIILISSLAGVLLGGLSLLLSGKGLRVKIPFGPFLAMGTLIYFFYGREIMVSYYRLFH